MILSHDETLLVVTPTKTATKALESEAKASKSYSVLMPRHYWVPPKHVDVRTIERIILPVRDPIKRLISMYQFGLHTKHSTLLKWAGGPNGTFETFLKAWLSERALRGNPYWCMLYSDYLSAIRAWSAPKVDPMVHTIDKGITLILRDMHIDVPKRKKLINSVHQWFDETPEVPKHMRKRVMAELKPDLRLIERWS